MDQHAAELFLMNPLSVGIEAQRLRAMSKNRSNPAAKQGKQVELHSADKEVWQWPAGTSKCVDVFCLSKLL